MDPILLIINILLVFVGLCAYMLPTIIAKYKKHPSTLTIGILNTFLGWTGFGWFILVVWAFKQERLINAKQNN